MNNHYHKVSQEVAENCAFHSIKKKKSDRIFIEPLFPCFPIVISVSDSLCPDNQKSPAEFFKIN